MKEVRVILNRLLDKYENSKHLFQPGISARRVMLRIDRKELPEYDYQDPSVRDAYNAAAVELERQSLVRLEWSRESLGGGRAVFRPGRGAAGRNFRAMDRGVAGRGVRRGAGTLEGPVLLQGRRFAASEFAGSVLPVRGIVRQRDHAGFQQSMLPRHQVF